MLLRNNGCAAACGNNCSGECDIPALEPGLRYIADSLSLRRDLVVQLDFVCEDDAITPACSCLAGNEVLLMSCYRSDSVWETHRLLARKLNLQSLRLPSECQGHNWRSE